MSMNEAAAIGDTSAWRHWARDKKTPNFKAHGQFYTIYFGISTPYLKEQKLASVWAGLCH